MGLRNVVSRIMGEDLPLPWSAGYNPRKNKLISDTLADPAMMQRFARGERLPDNFGDRIDERVVEYPWVLSRLSANDPVLDAGSTFSSPLMLESPQLRDRRIIIYTLLTDWITLNPKVSYIFGDFREMLLKDACVRSIACISTLEHVGMGQSYKDFDIDRHAPDEDLGGYRIALSEFARVLKPGGQLLLTVPYGKRENHGWLQQFDATTLAEVASAFPGHTGTTYYRYRKGGWQVATAAECADAAYYNIHARKDGFDPDYAAAARAVACLEFHKP